MASSHNYLDLGGRKALITGGASGIARETAALFVKLGAQVVLADVNAHALEATAAEVGAAGWVAGDISKEADVEHITAQAIETLGGLNTVFNCAGISCVASTIDQAVDDWQRVIDINLRGTHMVARATARHMAANGGGAIVNITSVTGAAGFPRRSAYATSKAAVAHMTRCWAAEWGHLGIRVVALAPGYIKTPMAEELIRTGKVDAARIEKRTPMGRYGTTQEIAQAAAFLVSDWAAFITGTELTVDGGWTSYGGAGDVDTF